MVFLEPVGCLSPPEHLLRDRLEALYRFYGRETAAGDPIVFPLRFERPQDREVVAWIASAFAYGRVETIQRNVGRIVAALGPRPAAALDSIHDFRVFCAEHLRGFRHRFHSRKDAAVLLYVIAQARRQAGSLRAFFESEVRSEESDVGGLLSRVVGKILSLDYRPVLGRRTIPARSPARFFFPDPNDGSACKRWNLLLRWMVRHDALDFGLWPGIPAGRLLIPTDTHIHLISRRLGLTRRKTADWKTAQDITRRLARFDPADPVRYDYALCRVGISGICTSDLKRSRCGECLAAQACPPGRRRIRAAMATRSGRMSNVESQRSLPGRLSTSDLRLSTFFA